tara:strand:- start:617 stop:760 length:144 start_codon:yes stop_codon:yes gene_type:complete
MDNMKEAQNPRKLSEGPRKESTGKVDGIMPARYEYKLSGNAKGYMKA